jgi:hypothetical protein
MMAAAPAGGACSANIPTGDIFNQYQNYNGDPDGDGNKNYVVFKGCQCKSGNGLKNVVKVIFFDTPEAVKDTDSFKIELYKKMDTIGYTFENLILSSSRQITADFFTSGYIASG